MKKIYKLLTAGLITAAVQLNAQCPVPTSVTATPGVICAGSTTSLNATSAGSSIMWYTVPTCGIPTGTSVSGANFSVSPVVTTTFYAEAFSPAVAGGSMTLNYTGCVQQVVIPAGVNQITVDAYGAQGIGLGGFIPGNGGRAQGVLTVTAGQILNIYVGGNNAFNGGGIGQGGAHGGGASDVRIGGFNYTDRVIVAGGGGGAHGDNWQCNVGAGHGGGGTAVGANFFGGGGGAGYTSGTGCGTNGGNAGGIGGNGFHGGGGGGGGFTGGGTGAVANAGTAGTGSLGLGGAAFPAPGCVSEGAGGGGGGYYGGGGAVGTNCGAGRGGGGSSWTGTLTSPLFQAGVRVGNGQVLIYGVNGGCVSASRTPVTVTVNPSPTVAVAGGTAAICAGSSVTLTASGATSYSWSNGALTSTIAPTPTTSTSYTVIGTSAGCSTSVVKNVTVNPIPTVAVSGSTLICGTGTNILTASGANTYSWSTGALTASISASPSVTTNYTVIGTNTLGNCTSTQTLALVVSTNPTVAVAGAVVICNGQTTTLTASGASTYSWNNGAVTAAVALSPTATTAYTVVGTNTAGCAGANMQTITVNPSPTVSVVGGQTICLGGQTASLSASGANTYSWSNGATTSSIIVSPTVTTTYTAIGTSSVNGCTGMNTAVVTVDPCIGIANIGSVLSGLSVYPNPGTGDFTIELKNGSAKTIVVTDYTGKIVFTSTSSRDLIHVNLSSMANGIYNVKIESNNSTEILKLVKQ